MTVIVWVQGTKAMITRNSSTSLMARREENRRRSGIWTASQDWSFAEVARSSIAISSSPVFCRTRERTLFRKFCVKRATEFSSPEQGTYHNVVYHSGSGVSGQFFSGTWLFWRGLRLTISQRIAKVGAPLRAMGAVRERPREYAPSQQHTTITSQASRDGSLTSLGRGVGRKQVRFPDFRKGRGDAGGSWNHERIAGRLCASDSGSLVCLC